MKLLANVDPAHELPAPVQEPDNLQCKTVQKRLATQWGYVEAQQPRKAVKLTTDEYTALAHRIASKYTHRSDPNFTGYTFLPNTLEQFVRAIEQAALKKNGGDGMNTKFELLLSLLAGVGLGTLLGVVFLWHYCSWDLPVQSQCRPPLSKVK